MNGSAINRWADIFSCDPDGEVVKAVVVEVTGCQGISEKVARLD